MKRALEETMKDLYVYQQILNPNDKLPVLQADAKKFARLVHQELEQLTAQLADQSSTTMIIDGKKVDKTSATGQLLINNKLSELESQNTNNFNLISVVQKTEDTLRQMMG